MSNTQISIREAVHPEHFNSLSTSALRSHFLLDEIFRTDSVSMYYLMYDRLIVGGVLPVSKPVHLVAPDILKAQYFLERREIGIINVGGQGSVTVDGQTFVMNHKDALYLGKATRDVIFLPGSRKDPPVFYFNSAPAHRNCMPALIKFNQAEKIEIGSKESANNRVVYKLIVSNLIETCQLQMGLTELNIGSIWNTMPPHIHNRRTEVYFYFNVHEHQAVSHYMGLPNETRSLWIKNHQAVISPPWSIHAGVGTSSYSFIWSMAGENLDYADMDPIKIKDLR